MKKLFLDNEPPLVRVHYDGRKKQSFDDVHPGLIKDFIEGEHDNVSVAQTVKIKKNVSTSLTAVGGDKNVNKSADRNMKVKQWHAAVVQKLEGNVADLEIRVKDLTAQKDTATADAHNANLECANLKIEIKELSLKLKTAKKNQLKTIETSAKKISTLTSQLDTSKADLRAAQEKISTLTSESLMVVSHLKTKNQMTDQHQTLKGELESAREIIAKLKKELTSLRSEKERVISVSTLKPILPPSELNAKIDMLTAQLSGSNEREINSKKRQIGSDLEEAKEEEQPMKKHQKEVVVKVKLSNVQVGEDLTAKIPYHSSVGDFANVFSEYEERRRRSMGLCAENHDIGTNSFVSQTSKSVDGLAYDACIAAAEQIVDSSMASTPQAASFSLPPTLNVPQVGLVNPETSTSAVDDLEASHFCFLIETLNSMPPNVREAAMKNPQLAAKLIAKKRKERVQKALILMGGNTFPTSASVPYISQGYSFDAPGSLLQLSNGVSNFRSPNCYPTWMQPNNMTQQANPSPGY